MQNLEELIQLYAQSEIVGKITARQSDPKRMLLSGTKGSVLPFYLAAAANQGLKYLLLVSPEKESAAYLYNDLINLTSSESVHLLPDSFKRPGNYERFEPSNALARTEIINQISMSDAPYIIVSYPEALMEKSVDSTLLAQHRIKIKKGETIDVDTIIDVLLEYGFVRTDFVFEPGQFSIRGGIVDIFSFGSEWPYRIELFDEEVESIRLFHPSDQRSLRSIEQLGIVPDVNKNFQTSQKSSLLTSLQKDTMVVFTDLQFTVDRWNKGYEAMLQASKALKLNVEEKEASRAILNQEAMDPSVDFLQALEPFSLLFTKAPEMPIEWTDKFTSEILPQPDFNKNFTLLIEDLDVLNRKKYQTFLFAENPKQIERFYSIFEDLEAPVKFIPINKSLAQGFIDEKLKIACYTDHQIIKRFHRYRLKHGFSKSDSINMRMLRELRPGDFVTHIDHGVGRYSGLEKIDIGGHNQESVRLIYHNNDVLYVSINSLHKIAKFSGKDGTAPKLSKLGSDAWQRVKNKTKKKVKDIAGELIKLYARRKASQGFAFPPDGHLQNELEASFIYEDTPDQMTATQDVKEDMQKAHPMDRLICGDVGFGKTEVAMRAAFKAVLGGKQVAVLVPTTILALQHQRTFSERLKPFGTEVDYINRFRTTKEKNEVIKRLKEGSIDIVIGTHGLLNKKIEFKDLGLLIIDEEQKFGVAAKEKLRNITVNVDTLTLTATPIPRTLQFSLMAARDMSILRTAPPNRRPIHTEVRVFNQELVRDAIDFEVNRGGQVFFVHNRVKSLMDMGAMLKKICPDISMAIAHGQMAPEKLERTLVGFIDGDFDVLLSTNIIETGLDIPNVNTIIINNAHHFGMSDLHQLRGRVGRSNRKAYCYLFAPPLSALTVDARKRLKTLEEFSDLGSGFHIAMKDMDIRGAGNLLGGEQSGFISDIGYETYQKILNEAITELKESEFKELFKEELEEKSQYVHDVIVDTDIEMDLPGDYVRSGQERLNLYTEIDQLEDKESVNEFQEMLRDRFGPIPQSTKMLFAALEVRWACKKLGFSRVIYKNDTLRMFFVENAQSVYYESDIFHRIMQFVATQGGKLELRIKENRNRLFIIRDEIDELTDIVDILHAIEKNVIVKQGADVTSK